MEWTFTDETWKIMNQLQAIRLGESLNDKDLSLTMTKLTSAPLSILRHKVDQMLGRSALIPVYD